MLEPTLKVQETPVVEPNSSTGDQREEIDEASVSGFKSNEAIHETLEVEPESVEL